MAVEADPPPWLLSLQASLTPLFPNPPSPPSTRSALILLRLAHAAGGDPHALVLVALDQPNVLPSLLNLLTHPRSDHLAPALVAIHALCTEPPFRDRFIAAAGVSAVADVVRARVDTSERESPPLGGGSSRRLILHEAVESPPRARKAVWNAAIRTLAKLMVCSTAACATSIDSGALALLARAAIPGQPMDIRLRAAAGLAAIAAWSGPRRAVEIVETEDVVLSMTGILTEGDERVPSDLRTATIDGLVVMSFRRHAKRVLQKFGTEEKIRAAARLATVSGDYAAAARGTVAAGQLTGRSVDEYGFLVQDEAQNNNASFTKNNPGEPCAQPNMEDAQRQTGLNLIKQQLLEEPYASVEDFNVLEEIVHEEAGVLSSSPRDRNYIRRAARTYGVSADEIEFISLLEDDPGAAKRGQALRTVSAPMAIGGCNVQKLVIRPLNGVNGHVRTDRSASPEQDPQADIDISPVRKANGFVRADSALAAPVHSRPTSGAGSIKAFFRTERDAVGTGSSPQRSSLVLTMEDPDYDPSIRDGEGGSGSSAGSETKSKMQSPLLMFSSATKRAAEKDAKNHLLQKTSSQLTRDTEHERMWREVIDNRPEMLRREKGRVGRVAAYRELALIPVPPPLRRRLWPILLDTAYVRETKPGLYKTLCTGAEEYVLPDDIEHTIEADVTRTMPLHSLFWAGGAQVGVQSLRSILRAYARYIPEVGYCQGMSSIAAVLIMNAGDEEEAFLMMVQFMSRFQYKKVFAPGFPLMLQWISELKPLVAHYMPELSQLLDRENVSLELYADKWLITALSHNFPHRHLLRVWDLMFLGGSPKIILKACLAVLKQCEVQLLKMDFETMMPFLQRGFAEPEAGVLDPKDPEPFITMMREFRFLVDLPKAALMKSAAHPAGSSPDSRSRRREGRRFRSCVPCFRRSQTVD